MVQRFLLSLALSVVSSHVVAEEPSSPIVVLSKGDYFVKY